MSRRSFSDHYRGKRVLVTGGLGFIGSNLALDLVNLGAHVTVIDCSESGCGANAFNVHPAGAAIRVAACDIGGEGAAAVVEGSEIIFNLAGEVSHIHSMLFPERDLRINTIAQLRFLETVARTAPRARIVYASTRQVYGAPQYLPVDERHSVLPADYNGVHKFAACHYHSLLTRLGRVDAIVLRLSNVYGPRMTLAIPCQGFLSVFTARTMQRRGITLYGTGEQLRDPIYVADACEAFLRAGMVTNPPARLINIGSPEVLSLAQIAGEFSSLAGLPPAQSRPFPPQLEAIDIGDYYSCLSACQSALGWLPSIPFREGLRKTLDYYGRHLEHYLPEGAGQVCPLHGATHSSDSSRNS